jgi:hypothetical protein
MSRSVGFGGPQPITVSDIQAYCQLKRIQDLDERKRFVRLIKSMDERFLESVRDDDA